MKPTGTFILDSWILKTLFLHKSFISYHILCILNITVHAYSDVQITPHMKWKMSYSNCWGEVCITPHISEI